MTPAITVSKLTRRFGEFVAVDDVSFDVRQGEIFGFLGANGAGKSTTIRMLCGLLRPTSGTAIVGGVDVARDPEAVKLRIGYMSQKFSLYEALTVDQNIRFFGGVYGLEGERFATSPRLRARDGGPGRAREDADPRSRRRLAPAAGARLRDPARAADRVSRRADRRRRPGVAPSVLAPDRPPVAAGHDGARHDPLPGRSRALPPHRRDERRQARGAGHDARAQAGVCRPADHGSAGALGRGRDARARARCRRWRRPACSARRSTPCCAHATRRPASVVAGLRAAGVTATSVVPVEPSLEDVFLDLVERTSA